MNQFKVGTRLAFGFSIVMAVVAFLASISYYRISVIGDDIELIVHDRYAKVELAQTVENEVNKQLRAMRTAMIVTEPALIAQELQKIENSAPLVVAALQKLESSVRTPEGIALLTAIKEARSSFRSEEERVVRLIKAGQMDEARSELPKKVLPLQARYLEAIEAFSKMQAESMAHFGATAVQTAYVAERDSVILAVAALVIGAVVAMLLTRSITLPIREAVRVAHTVASGDLTSRIHVHGKDELAELLGALKTMNESLASIVNEVRESSDSIATGSHQIAAGGVDLSQRTEEQASSIQQTAASMEEIATSVRLSAETSRTATELARSASGVARQGGEVVSGVVSTMGAITESSRSIAEITGVIDGIAFQTNILALNAAVEAARAGEHGRGFAVVAGEVRTLAQRAATAAKDIKGLIVQSMARVEAGAAQVEQAGATMDDIVSQASRVAQLISELSAGFEEQSSGIGQVNDAVNQMDQVTQQNAALVEESAAAAEGLRLQAGRLSDIVGKFRLTA